MKPARFDYLAPDSVDEAVSLLAARAPDARPLAGGQSLVPMMNFRLARPAALVDLNRIRELAYVEDRGDCLAIGSMTRERTIENSALVREAAPLLHEATIHIGHLPIRSRGTIGGSLANADPAAEYPAAAVALGCELVARSLRGERRIAAAEFFDGPLSTVMEADELLTEIVVPKAPDGSGSAFVEIARRHGDFALAGVAAQVTPGGGPGVRLAACGAGPGPMRLRKAEAALRDGCGAEDAARAAAAEVDPDDDLHASASYRRRLVGVMTKRAVATAMKRSAA